MSIIRQSSVLGLATLLEKVFAFAIVLAASRIYGSEGVGEFFYYFSLVCLFLPFLQMGFAKIFLQDWFHLDAKGRGTMLGKLLLLTLGLTVLVFLAAALADALVRPGKGNPLAIGLCVLAVGFENTSLLLRTPDQARKQFTREALIPGLCRLVALALLLLFSGRLDSGYQIAAFYAIANFGGLLVSLPALHGASPRFAWPRGGLALLRRGLPFSLTGIFVMISLFVDSVMLGHFSFGEVGHYNSAYRIVLVAVGLSAGVCHALFPRIVEFRHRGEPEKAARLVGGALRMFLILGFSMALGGILVGNDLIPLIYGDEFAPAGLPFCILCLLIPFSAAANIVGQSMQAAGHEREVMWINLRSACFNVVANLLLIPRYGMVGAAITTVCTEMLTVVQMGWRLRNTPGADATLDPSGLWRVAPFVVATGMAFLLLRPFAIWWQIPIGVLIVAVLLLGARRFWLAGLPRLDPPPAATS